MSDINKKPEYVIIGIGDESIGKIAIQLAKAKGISVEDILIIDTKEKLIQFKNSNMQTKQFENPIPFKNHYATIANEPQNIIEATKDKIKQKQKQQQHLRNKLNQKGIRFK